MKLRTFITFLIIFSLGWLLSSIFTNFIYFDTETPLYFSFSAESMAPERLSPSDHIKTSQISINKDKVTLNIPGASYANFANSNSMDPFLDEDSNSLEIAPASPSQINPGDVISYYASFSDNLVVHRVLGKGTDSNGTYFIVKGDNNPTHDPEKVRFSQVNGVLVAILY